MKVSIEEVKEAIDQIKKSHNKEKNKMMSDNDLLFFKYNEFKEQKNK